MTAPREETKETKAEGEPPGIEALARRFLDLWQSHVAAFAADPETNHVLGRLMAAQLGAAEQFVKAVRPAPRADGHEPGDHGAAAARAAPAAAPPPGGERDLAELARRLAACEERLARLEQRPRSRGRSPQKRARKRDG